MPKSSFELKKMYLNRFTISIKSENSISLEKIKSFNLAYSEIEAQLFRVMPKKINVGGYGYVSIKIHDKSDEPDSVKEYGQCADCHLNSYPFDIDEFFKKEKPEKFIEVLNIYQKGIDILSENMIVDKVKIKNAILQLLESLNNV